MGSVSVSSCRCCMFVSCVHPVVVLNAAFCMTCSLLMLVEDAIGHHTEEAYSRAGLIYILSVYSPFSDRAGLPLHNIHIPSPFTSIMDIFSVDLKFGHIHFYTL